MAYSTSNPPALKSTSPLTGAGQTWAYIGADIATDVDAVGFFTNGNALGMKVNDIVEVTNTATGVVTLHRVITSTAGGAVTVSLTGLTIT